MYMKAKVDDCDFTQKKYPIPTDGAWCISQGASGRWCWVMSAGPEYLEKHGITPKTEHEVMEHINKVGGWPDIPFTDEALAEEFPSSVPPNFSFPTFGGGSTNA